MARVLTFDLSLQASGWAVGDGGAVKQFGLIEGKFNDVPRLIHNRNRVMDKVDEVQPDLVVMEDLAFSRNMSFAKEIAGMAYMIRAELVTEKIPYIVVGPTQLKKFIVGVGGGKKIKVTKDLILLNVFKRFGHDLTDHNIADAVGLCYLGMALVGDWKPTFAPQVMVAQAVRVKNSAVLSRCQTVSV